MRVRRRTGHDVPVGEITRRWSACQENLVQTANLFGGIRLIDNTTHVSVTVVRLSGRSIAQATELRPPWAARLTTAIQHGWLASERGIGALKRPPSRCHTRAVVCHRNLEP